MASRASSRRRKDRKAKQELRRAKRASRQPGGRLALPEDRSAARRRGSGVPPIHQASISGLKGAILRATLKSQIGKKAINVGRQQFGRLPGVGRFFRGGRRPQVELLGPGGRSIATRPPTSIARRTAIGAGKVAIGGAAFEAGSTLFAQFAPRGEDVARRIRSGGGSRRGVPFSPGTVVPTDSITHTWVANGVPFAQLADGRVMVRRKNGTIKTFRRPRPIVLGRNPGVRDLVRADKKIDGLLKLVKKRFPARRTAAPRHSQQHN